MRLTSLLFPVEEEICNTGLSHGQKGGGGWGNEYYACLRSFLVWETVFAHSSNWCESLTKCCKEVGRRALRLTSLLFPVEEEICNTGLSHGQKGGGGWGNEYYACLRSFLVWETVFAHKRSCWRTLLALKLIIKQTVQCRSASASKYR